MLASESIAWSEPQLTSEASAINIRNDQVARTAKIRRRSFSISASDVCIAQLLGPLSIGPTTRSVDKVDKQHSDVSRRQTRADNYQNASSAYIYDRWFDKECRNNKQLRLETRFILGRPDSNRARWLSDQSDYWKTSDKIDLGIGRSRSSPNAVIQRDHKHYVGWGWT